MALVKQVNRGLLRREWRVISLVFAELVLVLLVVFQLLQIIGLHTNPYLMQIVLKPSFDPVDFAVLAIAVVAFLATYFAVKKRQPDLFRAEKAAPGIIKREARQKLSKIRGEPQAPALLLIEAAFAVVLVIAIKAYIDPMEELIPWSRFGIGPPFTTAINAIIALLVLGVFYKLYALTAWYREK